MTTALLIWAYITLGKVLSLAVVLSWVAVGLYVILFFTCWLDFEDNYHGQSSREDFFSVWKKRAKFVIILLVSCLFLNSLYPEKEDILYIVGGTVVLESGMWLMGNEEAQKLPNNVLSAANHFLQSFENEPLTTEKEH